MKITVFMFVGIWLLLGCSGEEVANGINRAQVTMVGNRPPASFRVANLQTMQAYVFNMKHYTIAMPTAKASDFKNIQWVGFTHYNKDIVLVLDPYYHISISTNYTPRQVTPKDTAILQGAYTFRAQRTVDGKYERQIGFINTHIEYHGKENYPCVVSESRTYYKKYKLKKYENSYRCYKFNPSKTKVHTVTIRLTYTKPRNAKLAKHYTYQDLKRRAKRMLDSLYIKDWW